jgi:hypothetical protein
LILHDSLKNTIESVRPHVSIYDFINEKSLSEIRVECSDKKKGERITYDERVSADNEEAFNGNLADSF